MPDLDHSGADTQEKDALLFILCTEFGSDHVHGGLADRVQSAEVQVEVVRYVQVREAAGYAYDFLGLAFEDKRHEQVVEMDVGHDVDVDQLV